MRARRLTVFVLTLGLLLGGPLGSAPTTGAAQADEVCFAETGQCLRGRFLAYWRENGGLALNGFPLTGERRETLEDGREYTVQYFERVRLELHPENQPPHDILLGQFGRRVLGGIGDPSPPQPGRVYFPETGHNLFARFLEFWEQNGGLARFGYPISEEYYSSREGGSISVQYFERARFEYHPENAPPYDVLLGQFWRQILEENDLLGVPSGAGFGLLYVTDERVRQRLNRPRGPATEGPGTYQAFERGALLYRGDLRRIHVLCGDRQTGGMLRSNQGLPNDPIVVASFPDTWREGEDPGGGPGPTPGLFLPRFGFGKLWREEPRVRDCLGYATTPDETAFTMRAQPFTVGAMLSATTPEGRFIYVVQQTGWNTPSSCSVSLDRCRHQYERYPDPSR